MADEFLYLETIGRSSGQPREIEIWFVAFEERFFVLSEHPDRSHWYRNIAANSSVRISIGTGDARECRMPRTPAEARVLDRELDAELIAAVSALMDAKYGWSNGAVVELSPRSAG